MKFGEKLRKIRESHNTTMVDLARELGITASYIGNVETGLTKPPTHERVKQIAKCLRLTRAETDELIDLAFKERAKRETLDYIETRGVAAPQKSSSTREIYLLGKVPAGGADPTNDMVEGMVTVDFSIVGNRDCFALKVGGDCLKDRGIFEGDIVIVQKGTDLENGNIAVVRVHDGPDEATTMKIWHKTANQVVLMPASAGHDPIVINGGEGKQVEIVGKVIYAYKDFR